MHFAVYACTLSTQDGARSPPEVLKGHAIRHLAIRTVSQILGFAEDIPGETAERISAFFFRNVTGPDIAVTVERTSGKGCPGVAGVQILPRQAKTCYNIFHSPPEEMTVP